jgi:diaminohydroxyphosphoribosylaminopyrimidine deaminase/5-amino-6-(5-phosphoribosylamino)uracil reductase
MDGYIASAHWKSKYITCKESRKEVHYLRSFCAVLVGINTILVDNPILDNRLLDDDAVIKNASSKIIILDSNLCTPLKSKVFSIKENRTIFIAYSENLDVDIPEIKKKKESLEKKGAILIKSPTKNGKIHLRKLLSLLSVEFNIIHILVEGGGKIFSSFINSMLFNELIIYTASIVLGDGVKAFPDVDIDILNSALNKYNGINFMIGKDVVSLFVNRE